MMLVDISQWRAAIGCFRVFTCKSERFSYALSFFSVLLQILKLYQFFVGFIFIAIVILPFTITVHFFIGHLVYARSCFLPLFSHSYSCIRLVSYILFELFKRIPFALNSLFRSKYRTIKYLFLAYFHLYAICIAYDASALPIIKKLGWPTINELIESETLKMVYKSVNNQAPIYLTEMFVRLSDACKRELRNTKTNLAVPRRKSAFGQKCFSYKGAKLWNNLSVEVKSSKSYEIFKKRINNANTEC